MHKIWFFFSLAIILAFIIFGSGCASKRDCGFNEWLGDMSGSCR